MCYSFEMYHYKYFQPLVRQLDFEDCCLAKDKDDGNTPLHLAARVGNVQAIESALLNRDILVPDDDDESEESEVRNRKMMKKMRKTRENTKIVYAVS